MSHTVTMYSLMARHFSLLAFGIISLLPLVCSGDTAEAHQDVTEEPVISETAYRVEPKYRVLPLPEKYIRPVNPDFSPTSDINASLEWIVYSDRSNNPTFTEPGGTTEKTRVDFLDQFYVVEEKGDYVHIYRDPQVVRFELSDQAVDFGWIRKDHLLLWHHCLVTEVGGIDRKAITINTIARTRRISDGSPIHSVEFLSRPDSLASLSDRRSQLFEFFYVYKRVNGYALLGKVAYVIKDEQEVRRNIVGWAPEDQLVFWNSRVAVEPNWEIEAAEERRQGKTARFFEDAALALQYKQGNTAVPSVWRSDSLERRPIGTWRRFPLISYSAHDSTIFFARVMGQIPGDQTSSALLPNLHRQLDQAIARSRHINVVFIVDATDSMGEYFDAAATAIDRSMEQLNIQESRNQFQFGAAIFRDYPEGSEVFKLKRLGASSEASHFLFTTDPVDHADRDQPEALFQGVYQAVLGAGFDTGHQNVCIVIGDAGNHRLLNQDVSDQEVIQALYDYQCHLLAVQVHHREDPAYDDFVEQMRHIALETARLTYDSRDQAAYEALGVADNPPKINADGTISGGAYAAWVIPAEKGGSKSAQEVEQLIIDFIDYTHRFNNDVVNAVSELMNGQSYHDVVPAIERSSEDSRFEIVDRFEPTILDVLTRRANLSREDLEVLRSNQFQLSIDASAPIYVDGQVHPLFKRVLLISVEQLSELISVLRRLTFASSDNDREEMVRTWKSILQSYMGASDEIFQEYDDHGKLDEMSFEKINEMVWGLPKTRPLLKNVRLGDIRHPHLFSPEDFAEYKKLLESTLSKLREIRNDPEYPFSFRTNEYRFYWIEEDIIP